MPKPALKLLSKKSSQPAFYVEELDLAFEGELCSGHSLHQAVPFPASYAMPPDLAAYLLARYSNKGDRVLDPFCASGSVPLEASLTGRPVCASDLNPLFAKITRAKIEPCSITDVTLRLQVLSVRRPVSLAAYSEIFSQFYDIETYREIVNLKAAIGKSYERIDRFMELIALGLLHGHSAGYFSAYTFPQLAVAPEEQKKLNNKRRQSPDYRAVAPRLLRKAAMILRDGIPSILSAVEKESFVRACDARNLSHIKDSSIDLLLTSPPLPGRLGVSGNLAAEFWLKFWFCGIKAGELSDTLFQEREIESYRDFVSEVLFEAARVVRPGGRAVLELGSREGIEQEVLHIVENGLSDYWSGEGLLLAPQRKDAITSGRVSPLRDEGDAADSTSDQSSEGIVTRANSPRIRAGTRVLILKRT